jgi:hypothetical protein
VCMHHRSKSGGWTLGSNSFGPPTVSRKMVNCKLPIATAKPQTDNLVIVTSDAGGSKRYQWARPTHW